MLECSLDIRRGSFHLQLKCRLASEWTVVFGPSGAGKSTLLRVLAGLEHAQLAHVMLDGQDISAKKAGTRGIGLVAQQAALFPHLNVAANIAYGLHGMERAAREQRVHEALELAGGEQLLTRRVQHLSGGEAQRIALARALVLQPRLLLLDEPFSALDGAAGDALIERLQPWARTHGMQVIQATHDATDAFLTRAEVMLLREGRIVAQGQAQEVLRAERERISRSFNVPQKPTSTGSISS